MAVRMSAAEESGQKTPEGSDEVVDQVRHVLNRYQNRLTVDNSRCVERYIKNEASLLVHVMLDGTGVECVAHFHAHERVSGSDHELLALFPDKLDECRVSSEGALLKGVGEVVGNVYPEIKSANQERCPVFVGVVQFIQLPQGVSFPSLVRFCCIDCIYNGLPNALYRSFSSGWVIRGATRNREIHLPIRLRAAARVQDQVVGDMVERTSEVLKYVGCNGCEIVRDAVRLNDVVRALSGLVVVLEPDAIGVGVIESGQPKLQILDVLFGPCDFRPDSA